MKAIDQLRQLLANGELHHVTYRCLGTIHEGLYFYQKSTTGFRGFDLAGCVNKMIDGADVEDAHKLVRGIGVHVGSYGNG